MHQPIRNDELMRVLQSQPREALICFAHVETQDALLEMAEEASEGDLEICGPIVGVSRHDTPDGDPVVTLWADGTPENETHLWGARAGQEED